MTTIGSKRRLLAAWAATAMTIALLLAALAFVIASPSLPDAWWPQTGEAFAASPSSTRPADAVPAPDAVPAAQATSSEPDVCDAIVGPAHAYCLGAPAPDAKPGLSLADSWPLGVVATGLTVLFVLRRRRRGL
ncbi:hypothetical protein [Streptomyces sp. NPDC050145]|uniref:hypothetical protein n=1 Tax=Streptomyces sp. NPDC050145 TaxID=3365602 RepID=UPI0037B01639